MAYRVSNPFIGGILRYFSFGLTSRFAWTALQSALQQSNRIFDEKFPKKTVIYYTPFLG